MSHLLQLWQSLSPALHILIVGTLLKFAVSGIRAVAPKIDGRWVHILVFLLSGGAMVLSEALNAGVATPYDAQLAEFFTAALTALGVNEATRKPGEIGEKTEKGENPRG